MRHSIQGSRQVSSNPLQINDVVTRFDADVAVERRCKDARE
jgi:hypothetical protein